MRAHAHARKYARSRRTKHHIFDGALPQSENEWNKWKNLFYEMKGDRKLFITPSLHLCFFQDHNTFYVGFWKSKCICALFSAKSYFPNNQKQPFFSITKMYGWVSMSA